MTELNFKLDWQNLSDSDKQTWTTICLDRKVVEVRKFEKKFKLQPGSCNNLLDQINPLQRWYEERSKCSAKKGQ